MGWRDRAIPDAAPAASGWRSRATKEEAPAAEPLPQNLAKLAAYAGGGIGLDDIRAAVDGITQGQGHKLVSAIDRLMGKGDTSQENAQAYAKAGEEGPGFKLLGALGTPVPGIKAGGLLRTIASRALPGALVSGAQSALHGDSAGEVVKNATGYTGLKQAVKDASEGSYGHALIDLLGAGGAGSLAVGSAAPYVGRAASSVLGRLARPVERSAAAQVLLDRGVKDLTVGQQAPHSIAAQLEDAGTSFPVVGRMLEHQRDAGRQSWQNAVLDRAGAPGATPRAGDASERLADAYASFEPAYGAIRETPAAAVGTARLAGAENETAMPLREAFDAAARDPSVYATEPEVAAAQRFLANQASLVDRAGAPVGGVPQQMTAGALLRARSNIRGAMRQAGGNQAAAALLSGGERAVTGGLEQQLPPEALRALRDTDASYGLYKTVEDAVRRAGDQPAGFGPSHLSSAIRSGSEGGAYARGAGGELRDLASAGRDVFESKVPHTGVRVLHGTVGTVAAPLMGVINGVDALKRAAMGDTALQQALAQELAATSGVSKALPSRTAALIAALRGQRAPMSQPIPLDALAQENQ